MSKRKKQVPLTERNPLLFKSMNVEKDVDQWLSISHSLNVLLCYSLRGMVNDEALALTQEQESMQELLFLKTELDRSISETLSNIPIN